VQGFAVEVERSGTPEIVTFQGTATFPQFSETGIWAIRYAPLSDEAGNFVDIDLADAGFPTELVVANSDTVR